MIVYEIVNNLLRLTDKLQSLDWELINNKEIDEVKALTIKKETEDQMNLFLDLFEEKADSCAYAIRKLKSDIELNKQEVKRLQERNSSFDGQINAIKKLISTALSQMGVEKLKTLENTIYIMTTEKIEIFSEEHIPDEFKIVTESVRIDRAATKKFIKAGNKIHGVDLVRSKSLVIK